MIISCNNCKNKELNSKCLTCKKAGGGNNNWESETYKQEERDGRDKNMS